MPQRSATHFPTSALGYVLIDGQLAHVEQESRGEGVIQVAAAHAASQRLRHGAARKGVGPEGAAIHADALIGGKTLNARVGEEESPEAGRTQSPCNVRQCRHRGQGESRRGSEGAPNAVVYGKRSRGGTGIARAIGRKTQHFPRHGGQFGKIIPAEYLVFEF
jgi:hypothetical protein